MKKILSIVLSVMMVFCFMPGMAFAEETVKTAIPLENASIQLEYTSHAYTGSSLQPKVISIKSQDGKNVLNETDINTFYSISYGENKDVTTSDNPATVTITQKGSDASNNTKTVNFTITPKSCLDSSIKVSISDIEVGKNVSLTVKDGTTPLTQDTDYTIPEGSKTALGTNNITLTFKGNYSGTRNFSYEGKYDIADCYEVTSPSQDSTTKLTKYEYSRGVKRTTSFTLKKKTADANIPVANYTVEYSNNETVTGHEVTATIKGTGNFFNQITGVKTGFIIVPKSIKKLSISVGNSTNANTEPPITVKDGDYTLVKGTDYTVDTTDSTNKKVTITGQGNYNDATTVSYSVGTGITSVTPDKYSFEYNGYDQRPNLTVKTADGAMVPSNGYRIEWPSDTKTPGTKNFRIVGIGAYAGELSGSYTILRKDLSKCDITLSGTSFPYTGYAITPTVTVKDGYNTLKSGTDYDIRYGSNVAKGTATVTITAKGNYSGSKVVNFYIGTAPIQRCSISLDKTSYNYTGSAIKPTVKVMDGSKTVSTLNYVVTYKNNVATGTGIVVVTGKNDYYGVVELPFSIVGKTVQNCTITVTPTSYMADGYEKRPAVTVKDGYKTLVNGTDYTVTYSNNKIAGTASVTITGKGGYSGTVVKNFTITGLKQTMTLEKESYLKYPTSKVFAIPAPTATGDGTGFSYVSSDPSVVTVTSNGIVTPVGPGKATITVTTIGVKRYEPVSKKINITVKPNRPQFKLTSPSKGRLKVSITKLSNVDGYQIKYSRTDSYKYYTYAHRFNDYKTQYKIFKGLKRGAKYKVRVRSYKILPDGTKLYSNWMNLKTLKVK